MSRQKGRREALRCTFTGWPWRSCIPLVFSLIGCVFYFTRIQVAPKSPKGFSPKWTWTIFPVWSPAGDITAHTSRLHVFLPQFHTMTIKMEGLGVTQSCWIPEPGPLAHAETIISRKGRQGFRQLNKNPLLLFTASSKPNNNSSGVFVVVVFYLPGFRKVLLFGEQVRNMHVCLIKSHNLNLNCICYFFLILIHLYHYLE